VVNNIGVSVEEGDKRKRGRGRVCTSFRVQELVTFLVFSGTPLPTADDTDLPDDKTIKQELFKNMDKSMIRRFGEVTEFNNGVERVVRYDKNLKHRRMRHAFCWYRYIINQSVRKAALCDLLETRMIINPSTQS
jgi:hypothetical protein